MSPAGLRRFLFISAPFGGIEQFVRSLRRTLEQIEGVETHWVFLARSPAGLMERSLAWSWTLRGSLSASRTVRALQARVGRLDAVLVNHTVPASFLRFVVRRLPLVMSLDATPAIIDRFGPWYKGGSRRISAPPRWLSLAHAKRVYGSAARLLPWSELVRDSLVSEYGQEASRMRIVPPGVDLSLWRPQSRPDRGENAKVLFVGDDFARKGGELLLDLAGRAEFQGCHFDVVSRNAPEHAAHNVEIHRAIQPGSPELLALFSAADVFVLPTFADIVPTIAICEAMASSLPVITTTVGGLASVVEDGTTGFVVPPGDPVALASRLRLLVTSAELRGRLGAAGRAVCEARFDVHRTAATVLEELMRVADGRPGG
jgi:glycosyltransferase involved in cell wall biosynthesis